MAITKGRWRMATTQDVIRGWLERAVENKATHMIVVTDTWNYEDMPVFVQAHEDVNAKLSGIKGAYTRVMEVYNLALSIDDQLREDRVWNL